MDAGHGHDHGHGHSHGHSHDHGHSHGGPGHVCNSAMTMSVYTAAAYGRLDVLKEKGGAFPDLLAKADRYGYTPLHRAAQEGHTECVKFLLDRGADVNASGCGATPLHRAAFCGCVDVVAILVARGADLGAVDSSTADLRTPLHKAAAEGHVGVIEVLLEGGADVAALDRWGDTPHQTAVKSGHPHAADILPAVAKEAAPPAAPCAAGGGGATAPDAGGAAARPATSMGASCAQCGAVVFVLERRPCCGEGLICGACAKALGRGGTKCVACGFERTPL